MHTFPQKETIIQTDMCGQILVFYKISEQNSVIFSEVCERKGLWSGSKKTKGMNTVLKIGELSKYNHFCPLSSPSACSQFFTIQGQD